MEESLKEVVREVKVTKEALIDLVKRTTEEIKSEFSLFHLKNDSSCPPFAERETLIPNNIIKYLPEHFVWAEPFYSLARHYFFLKSRNGADEMCGFLFKTYNPSSLNKTLVKNFFSGLRNEMKKKIIDLSKQVPLVDASQEYIDFAKIFWNERDYGEVKLKIFQEREEVVFYSFSFYILLSNFVKIFPRIM